MRTVPCIGDIIRLLLVATALPIQSYALADDSSKPERWSPELMIRVPKVTQVAMSPDGRQVVYAVRRAVIDEYQSENRSRIFLTSLDENGIVKSAKPLTSEETSCDEPQWSPDGRAIAFIANDSGHKNLWLLTGKFGQQDGRDGNPISGNGNAGLTTESFNNPFQFTNLGSDVGTFRWSPNGEFIAFTSIEGPSADEKQRQLEKNDAKLIDSRTKKNLLYVVAVPKSPDSIEFPRLVTEEPLSVLSDWFKPNRPQYDWSPDSRTIVVAHSKSPQPEDWKSADLSLIDVSSGTVSRLLDTLASEASPIFSPDGKQIAFTASDDPPTWPGHRRIHLVSRDGLQTDPQSETFDGFGRYSDLIGWSSSGDRLFFAEVHGTAFRLMTLPIGGQPRPISTSALNVQSVGVSKGMCLSGVTLNPTRTHFGFAWESTDRLVEAYVTSVEGLNPVCVSDIQSAFEQPPLGETRIIKWKSDWQDSEIEGLLTLPVGYESGKRYPLLLVIHGGPMGVFTQTFDGTPGSYPIAAFASNGFLVLRPNPRGSSGYGKKFRFANVNDWGGGDFRDLMTGVDTLISDGLADSNRMGVMGWSYGGYLTAWTVTRTKRFQLASVGAGVTNLISFGGTTDIATFIPDYLGTDVWGRDSLYRSRSPVFVSKGVSTPTLIQHGERDERVPLSQGQELFAAWKREGCPVEMVVYPRSPHSIDEPKLLIDCMNRNLDWFRQAAN